MIEYCYLKLKVAESTDKWFINVDYISNKMIEFLSNSRQKTYKLASGKTWVSYPNLHIASKAFASTEILKDYRFPYDLNQLVKNSLDLLVKDFNSYSGLNFTLEVNTTWVFTKYIIKITE